MAILSIVVLSAAIIAKHAVILTLVALCAVKNRQMELLEDKRPM